MARPRKGEAPIKGIKKHGRPQITEANKIKYARETVREAEKIMMKYDNPFPNPFNLDVKDLCKEAKDCWEVIWSYRNDDDHSKAKFHNFDEVLFAFECFCNYIKKHKFMEATTLPDGKETMIPIVPNITNLALWVGLSQRMVSYQFRNADDAQKSEYKRMLSDLLSEGALIKAYDTSSAIFSLKNLCDWADKREDRVVAVEDDTSIEEARKNLAELGYSRPRLTGGSDE